MPLVLVRYKPNCGLEEIAATLALALPHIVAPHLSLPERQQLDGQVNSEDIIVHCDEGSLKDVNSKDLEILIFAHDFPERAANLEERKEAIRASIQIYLVKIYAYRVDIGYVWVWLGKTAYGKL